MELRKSTLATWIGGGAERWSGNFNFEYSRPRSDVGTREFYIQTVNIYIIADKVESKPSSVDYTRVSHFRPTIVYSALKIINTLIEARKRTKSHSYSLQTLNYFNFAKPKCIVHKARNSFYILYAVRINCLSFRSTIFLHNLQ